MVASALVTLKTLTLGDLDTGTGWYQKEYVDSQIEAAIIPKSAQQVLNGTGLFVRFDALGVSVDPVRNDDMIGNSAGDGFVVANRQAMWYFDTFMYYFYDLQNLPHDIVNTTIDYTSTDPRSRTKVWLDEYLPDEDVYDDFNILVQYANPDYSMERVFLPSPFKDIDVVYSCGLPSSSPIVDWDGSIMQYEEKVPVVVSVVPKAAFSGDALLWEAVQALRNIAEAHPLGSYRSIQNTKPSTERLGSYPLFSSTVTLTYTRDAESV